ncbi:hypothetical protein KC319_g16373, partial [Hortaea werneckii]
LKIVPIYPPGGGGDAAGSAANPNYGVTITEGEAKEHAEASAKAREDARLVPLKKIEEAKNALSPTTSAIMAGMSPRDAKIMESLTAKDPATDPARDDTWASERGDSSTLGERPSVDGHILDEVKGMLRRESTKGKRKASSEIASRHYQTPGVPTIREPQGSAPSTGYGEGYGSATGYENVRPAAPPTYGVHPAMRSPYAPSPAMGPPQGPLPDIPPHSPMEMQQVGSVPSRSTSNPYRRQGDSGGVQRRPTNPTVGRQVTEEEGDDEYGGPRPYSGV